MGLRLATFAALGSAMVLTGCAPTLAGANERGGIIGNHGWSQAKSFDMAEKHCQKYGRHARVSGTNDYEATLTFDCIP